MTTKLGTPIADFETQLATALDVGGTTATLQSAADDDSVALPAGRYFFTLDMGNSVKEHISCDLSGAALTNIKSVSRQGVETVGAARAHRIGASVTITDYAHIKFINDLVSGATLFNSLVKLGYDADPSLNSGNTHYFATVGYVNGVAVAGAPDAGAVVKGISYMSVAPASPTSPISVGDNDPRVPTQNENNAMVGNNTDIAVGSGNKMVTQTGLQHGAEKYAADAGSNDTYVITLSPAPTSYTAGMEIIFKANTANTGAATLNINSIGVKTIVKGINTTLLDGDILVNQFCKVIYDGTNFVLQNPSSSPLLLSVASDTLKLSADTEYTLFSDSTYYLRKEFFLPYAGTVRVKMDLKTSNGGAPCYYDLRTRNGGTTSVASGSQNATTYTTTTVDIYVEAGEVLRIYQKGSASAETTYIKNCRICYDTTIINDGTVILN